jgi:ribonuclease BN (tRNA processing enzyme)
VYASDVGYGPEGLPAATRALYQDADLLIHDSTYTPEDRARYPQRGLASVVEAVAAAVGAQARRLALFHYDQDYTDSDVDALVARGRRAIAEAGATVELIAATEGLTLTL